MRLPKGKRLALPGPGTDQEWPVIYLLALCDESGRTPTKSELQAALRFHLEYNKDPALALARSLSKRDHNAEIFDHTWPNLKDRSWISGTKGKRAEKWKLDAYGQKRPHARRYGDSSPVSRIASEQLCKFLAVCLQAIDHADANQRLPWSVCYDGWTRKKFQCARQHRNHENECSATP